MDWLKKKNAVQFSLLEEYNNDENFEENIADSNQLSSIEHFYQESLSRDLSLAVGKLQPKYNQVINLYYKKGLNFREISNALNESINTVKSRYRRGIISLRNLLLKDE